MEIYRIFPSPNRIVIGFSLSFMYNWVLVFLMLSILHLLSAIALNFPEKWKHDVELFLSMLAKIKKQKKLNLRENF